MTKKILIVLTTVLLITSAMSAYAQFSEDKPSKFGFRLVTFMPANSDLRNIKSTWFGPAIDWHLKLDEDNRPKSYLSLTLLNPGEDAPYKPSSNSLSYTRLQRKPISESRSHYMGYGAGVYKLKVGKLDGYQAGIHGLYGQEFHDTYFAELCFDYVPDKFGVNWSGIMLSVGTRISM